MENKECPYCGQILSTRQFNHHVKNCFKNPVYVPYLVKGVSVNNTEDIEALRKLPVKIRKSCNIRFICEVCKAATTKKLKYFDAGNLTQLLCERCTKEKTVLEKYGVKNVGQLESTKQKFKETCKKKFGFEHPTQSVLIKNKIWENRSKEEASLKQKGIWENRSTEEKEAIGLKISETWKNHTELEKKESLQKYQQTCREKYGTDFYVQSNDFRKRLPERISKSCKKYTFENTTFDSSWELAFWIWAKDNGKNIKREPVGIQYKFEGKLHTYFPDFEIDGKLIEIKGNHFLNKFNTDLQLFKLNVVAPQNGVTILYQDEIQPYLNYCKQKFHDKYWFRKFRNSQG